jgi:hypothetical protein
MPVTEVRKLINAIDNDKAEFKYLPFISEELRELVVLRDEIREEINDELKKEMNEVENRIKDELKKEMKVIKEEQLEKIQKLLNDVIKNLKNDNV